MTSTLEPSHRLTQDSPFDRRSGCDECRRQFAAAQRELGAFIVAARELYGPVAAAHAANDWLELMETIDLPVIPDYCDWQMVTIQAASRLAMKAARRFSAEMPMEGVQPQCSTWR